MDTIRKGQRVISANGRFATVAAVNEKGFVTVRYENGGGLDVMHITGLTMMETANASGAIRHDYGQCEATIDRKGVDRRCKNTGRFVPGYGIVCGVHSRGLR